MRRIFLCLVCSAMFSMKVFAQGTGGPGNPGGDPDNPVPLTGIEWLLIAGGILGAGKLLGRKKNH